MSSNKRVLALNVHPRSFGFVVFEGADQLLDWGVRSFRRGVNAVRVPAPKKLRALLDEFAPQVVVLRARADRAAQRSSKLVAAIRREAKKHRVAVMFVTPRAVKQVMTGHTSSKHEIASALAERFLELAPKLPPKRKLWQSEDYRMSIFDAAALGVAYFARRKSHPVSPGGPAPY
jgi:MinD-like ATPase involved in chromosome partitioning or flagellar assembly